MKVIYQEEIEGELVTDIVDVYNACKRYAYSDCSGAEYKACFLIDDEVVGGFIPCTIQRSGSYVDDDGTEMTIMELKPIRKYIAFCRHVRSH